MLSHAHFNLSLSPHRCPQMVSSSSQRVVKRGERQSCRIRQACVRPWTAKTSVPRPKMALSASTMAMNRASIERMFDNFKSVWYSLREIRYILREEVLNMAKATKTIRQALHYPPQYAAYFAANQILFNRVVAFYFEAIQPHEGLLALKTKEALTALEKLTHTTESNPNPIMPLTDLAPDIPALFRSAAINAALGSARSFFSSLKKWRARKEKHEAKQTNKGKKSHFRGLPAVPPPS